MEQVQLATDDEELQFKALSRFLETLLSGVSKRSLPPYLGSERSRIIAEVTSNKDPYSELKERSNKTASWLKPFAEELVEEGEGTEDKIRRALKIVAAANSMEFGVSGFKFDLETSQSEFKNLVDQELGINDSQDIAKRNLSSNDILYLTDNCGEIILDQILMKEIADGGSQLFIGAKAKPVQEDVTVDMVKELGVGEFGKVISTGGKVGIFPDEVPSELMKKWKKPT